MAQILHLLQLQQNIIRNGNLCMEIQPMIHNVIMEKLEDVNDLPSLSNVVIRLNQMLQNDTVTAADIARLISDDMSIMSKVLKTVNSSAYGLNNKVDSISQAISLLGEDGVRNIAMSVSAMSAFSVKDGGGFSLDKFWKNSISVGIAMNVLYENINKKESVSKDLIHLCGLMHGIGILVLVKYSFLKFVMSMRISNNENIPLVEAEAKVIATNHCEIGYWLAEKWKLPKRISNVIRYHSNPTDAPEQDLLIDLCHTAEYICGKNGLGDYGAGMNGFKNHIWKKLGFSVNDIPRIVKEIKKRVKDSELFELI